MSSHDFCPFCHRSRAISPRTPSSADPRPCGAALDPWTDLCDECAALFADSPAPSTHGSTILALAILAIGLGLAALFLFWGTGP